MLEFSSKFRVLLLPFIVLLQNKHTTLAENGENFNKRPASNKCPGRLIE